ncbi:phage/plasmid primase, P4 family [Kitasatospora sp. MMS16-BH015]|uniref:DNA primase family protein n=1 Tax=Kitasatospora sp. MMS16-BH015 TaxID=2018025 RepID=UPI000CF1FE55|nr:phage/plasmid primase, P4 family [Kitasatospora sp. MMS16-BH015]
MTTAPETVRLLTQRDGTDVDRAEFIADRVGGQLIYVDGPGWYAWDGRRWANDSNRDAVARGMVHDVSSALLTEAIEAGNSELIDAGKALRTSRLISAALLEMQAMPGIRRSVADLDTDPFALTFRNGTVDLRTGRLRPHDPGDLITRMVDLDYRQDADCPNWIAFLESSQPGDPEMHTFLQRLAGYAVTGSTREECLAFFYGSGRNGKGVFTETLGKVFAAVTTAQEAEFWEKQRNGRNGSLVAKLHGARLVLSSEMTAARLDEAFVKAFTAADLLTANQKYKPAYDFTPTALLIMSGNDQPTIKGTDEGIWRRFRCVPWDESFVGREDQGLKGRLLDEAEGIAAWVVRGAAEWHRHGLNEPERVARATDEYREESDPFADWAEANFEAAPDGFVPNSEIKQRGEQQHPRLPGQPQAWSKAVARHFGAEAGRQQRVNGKKVRGVAGVRLVAVQRDVFGQPR